MQIQCKSKQKHRIDKNREREKESEGEWWNEELEWETTLRIIFSDSANIPVA